MNLGRYKSKLNRKEKSFKLKKIPILTTYKSLMNIER